MAVTRDATGVGGTTTGAACTVSHTIATAGPTTVALAFVAISVSSNSTSTTCSATYAGTAMTQLGLTLLGSSSNRSAYGIYYLFNPASGAQNCVVTPAGASTKAGVRVATVSYTGVANEGIAMQSAAALTISATSVANGYNIFGHINGVTMTTPSQSQRVLLGSAVSGVGDFLLVQDAAGTGSNITFSVGGTATTPSTFGITLSEYTPGGVKFDAIGAGNSATASPISWSHTATGTDLAVFALVNWDQTTGSATVTYDGVAMTQLATNLVQGSVALFGMLDPPTGTKTVTATITGTTPTRVQGNSASYTAVDSFGSIVTANAANNTASISATAAAGGRIFNTVTVGSLGSFISGYNRNQRYLQTIPNLFLLGDAAGTGSSLTFTANHDAGTWRAYAVPLVQAVPPIDTLSDDFDAGIGANWTKAFSNNAAEVTASGGAVRIDHTAAPEYNLLQSVNNYDLTGSYAHVQVADFGNQALASQQVILGLVKDANNRVAFFGGGNQLIVESFTGGAKSTVGTPITLNTTAHRWLRIRESGGTMFFDTAPDGTTWTNRFSQGNPWAVTAMAVTLTCGNWQAEASASYAIFDNFNTAPTGPSASAAFTGSGALSATATIEYDRAATLTGTGTLSATISQIYTTTPELTGTGTLSATAEKVVESFPAAAALSGSGTLSATTTPVFAASAALSGSGTLTATATALYARTAALTGSGTATATVSQIYAPPAALTGSGTLSATATAVSAGEAAPALTGSGTLSATATRLHPLSAALTGTGALSGTVGPSHAPNLTGSGTLSATVTAQYTTAPPLSGSGSLTAAVAQVYLPTPALPGSGTLTVTATAQYTRAANLAGAGALNATLRQIYPVSAALTGAGGLTAITTVPGITSAILAGSGALTAAISQIYVATPALNGSGALTATANPKTTPALTGSGSLTATVAPIIAAALRGTGALNAAVIGAGVTAAGYASTGTLTVTVTQTYRTAPSLAGSGALTATVQIVIDVMQAYPDAIFVVRPETFTVTITAETRTVTVKAENTVAAVKAETRTVTVKEETDTLTMKPENHSLAVAR